MTSSQRWRLSSLVSFLLGTLHFLLFPLVNISSGESKPRGLFIDENAFTMNSKALSRSVAFPSIHEIEAAFDMDVNQRFSSIRVLREALGLLGGSCRVFKHSLMSCALHSSHKSRSQEATALVFPVYYSNIAFTSDDDMLQKEVIDSLPLSFALSVACSLRMAAWSSRNFVLIFLPMSASWASTSSSLGYTQRFSRSLNQYLNLYHDTNDHESVESVGLLRDSFVLDFDPKGLDTDDFMHPTVAELLSTSTTFESAEIRIVGSNGILSNMDFITAPLVTYYSRIFETEANFLVSKFHYYWDKLLINYPYLSYFSWSQSMYIKKFIGLLSFGFAQICGPSGLHGEFLDRDIESLTIHIKRSDRMQKNFEKEISQTESKPIMYILNTLHDVLRAHSTLHEELHHSMFFYMLMNRKEFVGISEYGFSLVFILLSLLLLAQTQFVQMYFEYKWNYQISTKEDVSTLISSLDELSFEKKPEKTNTSKIATFRQSSLEGEVFLLARDVQIALEILFYDLLPVLMISLFFSVCTFPTFMVPPAWNTTGYSRNSEQSFQDVITFITSALKRQFYIFKGFYFGSISTDYTENVKSSNAIQIGRADHLMYAIEMTGMTLIVVLLTTNIVHYFLITKMDKNQLNIRCYFALYTLYILLLLTWVGCQNYALAISAAIPVLMIAHVVEGSVSFDSKTRNEATQSSNSNVSVHLHFVGILINPFMHALILVGAYLLEAEWIIVDIMKILLGPHIEKKIKDVNSGDNLPSLCFLVVIFIPYSTSIFIRRVMMSREYEK